MKILLTISILHVYIQLNERLDISSINFSNDRMYLLEEVTPVDLQNCTFCFQKRVIVLGYRVVGSILKNTTRMCYCSWLMLV